MNKFIKLTGIRSGLCIVAVEKIAYVYKSPNRDGSTIAFIGGDAEIGVEETPEEIWKRIIKYED